VNREAGPRRKARAPRSFSGPKSGPGREASASPLYKSPEIYDVATGWDLSKELDFIIDQVFGRHARRDVRRVLEPCCGTGRLLAALAERGYSVAGYDQSAPMVAYARERLAVYGGTVWEGEMSTFRPPGTFDAAINLVNSIGYLLEEAAIAAHFERVGESIAPGGIYLIQLSYGGEPPELARFGPWGNGNGDLHTTLLWEVVREDPSARRSYQHCRITARRGRTRRVFDEDHVLRYWTHEDLDRLIAASPFRLEAIYWDRFEEFPIEDYRIGEYGNLYHVLVRKE
jgi:SAM-dependent methyltransferase